MTLSEQTTIITNHAVRLQPLVSNYCEWFGMAPNRGMTEASQAECRRDALVLIMRDCMLFTRGLGFDAEAATRDARNHYDAAVDVEPNNVGPGSDREPPASEGADLEALILFATQHDHDSDGTWLDDLVHDSFAAAAALINNAGVADQVKHLVSQWGLEGTTKAIDNLVEAIP